MRVFLNIMVKSAIKSSYLLPYQKIKFQLNPGAAGKIDIMWLKFREIGNLDGFQILFLRNW